MHLDASSYYLERREKMAILFHWHFELNSTNSQELLCKVFVETVCEKANLAYKRSKKWCSQNSRKLIYFDATTEVTRRKAGNVFYAVRL